MSWKGWEHFARQILPGTKLSTQGHKYHAQPTIVDGIRFDSKREAERYRVLKARLELGEIEDLQLQVPFDLYVPLYAGGTGKIGRYLADFAYIDHSGARPTVVVEDVKGVRTELYRWKKKHVEAEYGITIQEM